MYGSKDLNLSFSPAAFKQGKEESDRFHDSHQQQMSSGLLRYRSAPSTLLGDLCEEFLPHRSSAPEAESMFARFMAEKQSAAVPAVSTRQRSARFMPTVDEEAPEVPNSSTLQMLFHSPQPQQQQQIQSFSSAAPAESVYRVASSMGMEAEQEKSGGGGSSLLRQSSSPAGFFSQLNVENGFAMMRGMGGFRPGTGSNAESGSGTLGKLKGQINFSSRLGSTGLMSQMSEIGSDGIGGSSSENGGIADNNAGNGNGRYTPGYAVASWEDSVLLSDSFYGSKRARDHSEAQNGEMRSHVSNLTHHLSLPRNASEMASMEKFLEFQEAVPCKIRAKRGCATHPRSIAERMRRTRISERMRKLQELVPNMDKQTNTADMLDLAVEYIKDLQKNVKRLTDDRASCTCSAKQKP